MSIQIIDNNNTKNFKDGFIEIIDANNKSIKVKVEDLNDASTLLSENVQSINDNSLENNINFTRSIVDSENNIMDEESLISQVKSGLISALDVTFEATHSGDNKNFTVYASDSMENDSKSWLYPFAKPLIKNHSMYEEPIGRVVDASFSQSEFVPDRDTINVTFRVSDEEAMKKFADGRYRTMSIGASAKHITCNVCGKDILKDNKFKFCGHWRGETYANKTATWTAKDLEYKEGRVVNNPADIYAQVKKIKAIKINGDKNMSKNNDENKEKSALGIIDNLLSENNQEANTTDANVVNDNENAEENKNTTVADENNESTEKTVEEKLNDALEEINRLTDEVNELKANNEELKTSIESKDAEIESLNTSLTDKETTLTTLKEQTKALAVFNKELLKDSLKSLDNSLTDEDLKDKTAKEISDMIEAAKVKPREIGTVTNPGAMVNDNNTIVDGEDTITDTKKENIKTMKDFEEVINNFFN